MTLALTPAGLQTNTQADLVAAMTAKIRATFGNNTNTTTSSIMGQIVNIVSEFDAFDEQILLAVYKSFDPSSAIGVQLDRLCAITGTIRKGETFSVVDVDLVFNAAGTVSNGDQFQNDDTGTLWEAVGGPYSDTGGPYPETVAGTLQALDPGEVLANAGTTWSIITANPALDGLSNPADDADLGQLQESDPDLRVRRNTELFAQGQGPLAAIRGAVSKVNGVAAVRVYHNPTQQPADADGIPFKAFNVVVETNPPAPGAALRQAIADAIWTATGAGGEPYGTDHTETVTDSEGQPQTVRFDLISEVDVFAKITITTAGTEQPVSTNMAAVVGSALLAYAQTNWGEIGRNQLAFEWIGVVQQLQQDGEITGAVTVTAELSLTATGGPYADPLEIGIRERPSFESVNILVEVDP
jgi:uncharacterized phage protein gp47/JayE